MLRKLAQLEELKDLRKIQVRLRNKMNVPREPSPHHLKHFLQKPKSSYAAPLNM